MTQPYTYYLDEEMTIQATCREIADACGKAPSTINTHRKNNGLITLPAFKKYYATNRRGLRGKKIIKDLKTGRMMTIHEASEKVSHQYQTVIKWVKRFDYKTLQEIIRHGAGLKKGQHTTNKGRKLTTTKYNGDNNENGFNRTKYCFRNHIECKNYNECLFSGFKKGPYYRPHGMCYFPEKLCFIGADRTRPIPEPPMEE